jgi:uncharacterized protein YjbI with pentapeptide repeats
MGEYSRDVDCPPAPAVVVPRVRTAPGGAAQPLEQVIRRLIDAHARGMILLHARAGGGKSTALAHLRRVLGTGAPIALLDEPPLDEMPSTRHELSLVALREEMPGEWLLRLELAPWCEDDWIEYCSKRRREECGSVLARLRVDGSKDLLKGSPQLWRIVLDRLGADQRLPDSLAALREHLDGVIPEGKIRSDVAVHCAWAHFQEQPMRSSELPPELSEYAVSLLRHRVVRVLVASELIADSISKRGEQRKVYLAHMSPDLLRETAAQMRKHPAGIDRLEEILAGTDRHADAGVAALLLATDPSWRPRDARGLKLFRARLPEARWARLDLRGVEMWGADLHGADLSDSNLSSAQLGSADLHGARLTGANMHLLKARSSNFSGAALRRCRARNADLTDAVLANCDLSDADLAMTVLSRAQLRGANLSRADLRYCRLDYVRFDDADLVGTRFESAQLTDVRLNRAANVAGVSFRGAMLHRCNLEGLSLPRCDFRRADLTGSYLTGTFIPRGDFRNAKLNETALAEINWEQADLREADLRGCTFHMGSTRSGLVGSTIPCEGSKTGFYTDDFNDREFKDPEQIRKANLCRADLRGGIIEGVDFYLVDLRSAHYSVEQYEQLLRCGAILDRAMA